MTKKFFRTHMVFLAVTMATSLAAQGPQATNKLTLSHFQFGDANLDKGGELGLSQTRLGASFDRSLGRGEFIGLSLGATFRDYDFGGSTALSSSDPWGEVMEYDLGMNWRKPVGGNGLFFIAPNIGIARGEGADWEESLRFGIIVSYGYRFSRTLTVGIGAGIFTGLEETRGFPVLLVNWQISENWRLGNPFRPGPSGPAGLEIVYSFSPGWEVALGAGWRSDRFRLDESGLNPGGIGEVEGVPAFARLTWQFNETLSLDVYGGLFLNGEVTVETSGGAEIASDDLDSAPVFGLSLSSTF